MNGNGDAIIYIIGIVVVYFIVGIVVKAITHMPLPFIP